MHGVFHTWKFSARERDVKCERTLRENIFRRETVASRETPRETKFQPRQSPGNYSNEALPAANDLTAGSREPHKFNSRISFNTDDCAVISVMAVGIFLDKGQFHEDILAKERARVCVCVFDAA